MSTLSTKTPSNMWNRIGEMIILCSKKNIINCVSWELNNFLLNYNRKKRKNAERIYLRKDCV